MSFDEHDDSVDPEPLTIALEVMNFLVQPGSLGALAATATTAVIAVQNRRDETRKQHGQVRRCLYELDRSLATAFLSLQVIASFLDQFEHLRSDIQIGGSPILGHKNSQRMRQAHEDCRKAVATARDAFMDLSGLLGPEHGACIAKALGELNRLVAAELVLFGSKYANFILAAAQGLTVVDRLIVDLGAPYEFVRPSRDYLVEFSRLRDMA